LLIAARDTDSPKVLIVARGLRKKCCNSHGSTERELSGGKTM
jgi:hypothetical protein